MDNGWWSNVDFNPDLRFLSRDFAIDGIDELIATATFAGEFLWMGSNHLDDGTNIPGHLEKEPGYKD